jgi:hypothetical protein
VLLQAYHKHKWAITQLMNRLMLFVLHEHFHKHAGFCVISVTDMKLQGWVRPCFFRQPCYLYYTLFYSAMPHKNAAVILLELKVLC